MSLPRLKETSSRHQTRFDAPDWLDRHSVESVIQALRQRSVYPDRGGSARSDIERVQTHISAVFLTREHAFKFKRPVDLGFANFSTLEDRKRDCEAEVRLNNRLAEGVYLDVLPLYATHAGFTFDPHGEPVDYCVVMQRLAADTMLDTRLRQGRVTLHELEAVADVLARFHTESAPCGKLEVFGSLDVIRENWEENFRQTEHLVGTAISETSFRTLRQRVAAFMTRNEARFKARVAGGFIRDGHGDLRAEHIHLGDDGIKVIDCIEFNDRFRYGDVANDLAFLLMDLVALGHPDFSRHVLDRYLATTGDQGALPLIPFYACYRAYVRGKVTGFKLGDPDLGRKERAATLKRSQGFFRLAESFSAQMRPPMLVLVAGLMGTGKSSLAAALAEQGGLAHYNSDAIRKELARADAGESRESSSGERSGAAYGEDIYTPDWNARTYEALLAHGAEALRAGRSVVLDASFSRRKHRQRAYDLAGENGADVVLIECRLDEAATLERLQARWSSGSGPSDGRVEIYPRQKAAFEPIEDVAGVRRLTVTTDRPPGVLARELLPELRLPPPLFEASGPPAGRSRKAGGTN